MIGNAINNNCGAIHIFQNSGHITEEFGFNFGMDYRKAVFSAECDVEVDFGKALRHLLLLLQDGTLHWIRIPLQGISDVWSLTRAGWYPAIDQYSSKGNLSWTINRKDYRTQFLYAQRIVIIPERNIHPSPECLPGRMTHSIFRPCKDRIKYHSIRSSSHPYIRLNKIPFEHLCKDD